MNPTADDVLAARQRIRPYVRETPLYESAWLAPRSAGSVRLKLESLQVTGSFKVRGAFNVLLRRPPAAGVVAASAGNHGAALAYAGARFDVRPKIFTPATAPRTKLAAIRDLGGHLDSTAPDYDEAERLALAYAVAGGHAFISPYNDPDIISGAGTVALETLEQWPDVDMLVVPLGGGGLLSGIAIAARAAAPRIRIIGVEAAASPAFSAGLRAGRPTMIDPQPTLADGLAGNMEPDAITFPIVQRLVDEVVTVTEAELARAVLGLLRMEHLVVEGAGAAGVAAALAGRLGRVGNAVIVVSGGNIDTARLLSVLQSGDPAPGDSGSS